MAVTNLFIAGPAILAAIRAGTTLADFVFVEHAEYFSSEQDVGAAMTEVGGCVVSAGSAEMEEYQLEDHYSEKRNWLVSVLVPWSPKAGDTETAEYLAGPKLAKLIALLNNKSIEPTCQGTFELREAPKEGMYSEFGYALFTLIFEQRCVVALSGNCGD